MAVMMAAGLIMGGASIIGGFLGSSAKKKAAKEAYNLGLKQASIYKYEAMYNNVYAKRQAIQVAVQTDDTLNQLANRAKEVRGAQLSALAASGVVLGSGTAAELIDKTNELALSDSMAAAYAGENNRRLIMTNAANVMRQSDNQAQAAMDGAAASASALRAEGRALMINGLVSGGSQIFSSLNTPSSTYKPTIGSSTQLSLQSAPSMGSNSGGSPWMLPQE